MNTSNIRGWVQLVSDVNWEDYHGMWAKKAHDGSWYVLRWTNLIDAGGDDFADMPYECEVKRLDFNDMPAAEVDSALRSCGWKRDGERIVNEYDGDVVADTSDIVEHVVVEACIGYGLGAPLETFTGKVRPLNIRANARRYAEQCMRDARLLDERLARPVNRIGSTAAEYGRGDLTSALDRGPFDTGKNLMRRLSGLAPKE